VFNKSVSIRGLAETGEQSKGLKSKSTIVGAHKPAGNLGIDFRWRVAEAPQANNGIARQSASIELIDTTAVRERVGMGIGPTASYVANRRRLVDEAELNHGLVIGSFGMTQPTP